MAARDPRLRPFRIAIWAVYLTVVAVAAGLTILSVVTNLRGPHRAPAAGTLPTHATLRVCVTELEALHKEQNERAWRLGSEVGQADAVAHWLIWSRGWEERIGDLADRCRLEVDGGNPDGRRELAAARTAVLAVHRAYAAQVDRFGQEQADLARAAASALSDARAAAARPPVRR